MIIILIFVNQYTRHELNEEILFLLLFHENSIKIRLISRNFMII